MNKQNTLLSCSTNLFVRGQFLVSENNHGSSYLCLHKYKVRIWVSFIHLVVCLSTGPNPLPKWAVYLVWSRASSVKWEDDHPVVLTIKPTRCTDFSNLFWNKILHVSDSSSVHYQEFFTLHTAMVYVFADSWRAGSRSQAVSKTCMTYTTAVCTV